MGAWIEILYKVRSTILNTSHPTMGAWIEIQYEKTTEIAKTLSHPTMGAWIEIDTLTDIDADHVVAPHDGCVD